MEWAYFWNVVKNEDKFIVFAINQIKSHTNGDENKFQQTFLVRLF